MNHGKTDQFKTFIIPIHYSSIHTYTVITIYIKKIFIGRMWTAWNMKAAQARKHGIGWIKAKNSWNLCSMHMVVSWNWNIEVFFFFLIMFYQVIGLHTLYWSSKLWIMGVNYVNLCMRVEFFLLLFACACKWRDPPWIRVFLL